MLDSERNDRYGVPLPRIHYRIDDYVKRAGVRARGLHEDILNRVGVTEIHHRDSFAGASHIMGTARMGEDPKRSVVDPELRCHDHANLFLLGSAVFPTGAAANPTLTIAALSLRAVETVKKFLKS